MIHPDMGCGKVLQQRHAQSPAPKPQPGYDSASFFFQLDFQSCPLATRTGLHYFTFIGRAVSPWSFTPENTLKNVFAAKLYHTPNGIIGFIV